MKKLLVLFLILCVSLSMVFAEDSPASHELVESEIDIKTDTVVDERDAEALQGPDIVDIDDVHDVLEAYYKSQKESLPDIGRKRVALVLSGGGAKGIAHIPIIEALEKYGIPIDKVYGTSMGALIGGLYCAGYSPKEMTEIVKSQDLMSLFTSFESTGYKEVLDAFDYNSNNVFSISLGQGIGGVSGLIDDYQVLNFLNQHIGNVPNDIDFDKDLVIPFECNAADMLTGDEVVLREGNLLTAMRASMSIPIVFEPVRVDGDKAVLMDGGVVCNYIVHRALIEGYDIIIVVTLDGYHKEKITAESYNSFSGVMNGTLSIILNNVSKGEVELADYWFSPDLTNYTTFSFGAVDGILQKGYEEVEQQQAKFQEIADLFTEDQKVFKDPDRVSEYHTKYREITKDEYYSSAVSRHEDFMGRTRLSMGVYGTGGYGFFFKPEPDEYIDYTRRVFFPTVSLRGFIKDLNGLPLSLDIRLKTTVGRTSELSATALYRVTEDIGERVFGMGRLRADIGSLSAISDQNEMLRIKMIEGRVAADLGVLVTNESDHQMQAYFTLDNTWGAMNSESQMESEYGFVPSFTVSGVYYPNYTSGFFDNNGSRYDLKTTIGYNVNQKQIMYSIALAAESTFAVGERTSVWVDGTAFTSKGLLSLRSTYMQYGGWDGMPGYSSDIMFADFIYAGVGAQFKLSEGFASTFLSVVIRGGLRSTIAYGLNNALVPDEFTSWAPFVECFTSGKWDLGISVGYGVHTFVGDMIFGVGFNKNLHMALYIELT